MLRPTWPDEAPKVVARELPISEPRKVTLAAPPATPGSEPVPSATTGAPEELDPKVPVLGGPAGAAAEAAAARRAASSWAARASAAASFTGKARGDGGAAF